MILSPTTLFTSATFAAVGAYALAALWPQAGDGADTTPAHQGLNRWPTALWLLAAGWLAQSLAIAADAMDWQSGVAVARFGFAPALSFTVWMVLLIYAIERLEVDSPAARRSLAWLAVGSCALAWLFPGQVHPSQHALAPLHWVLGLSSYGLFGAALLHAAFMRRAEKRLKLRLPPAGIPLLKLESLTFRFVMAGFLVLSATLVLGYAFASPWRWDHKSVFSVLSWGVFLALLLGRRIMGWRGRTATIWLSAGSLLLLLAYVGSRFVLQVLLHRPAA
jgi:ABC-type uncharacterized transport system permease subunit